MTQIERYMREYARLIVRGGVNLGRGQRLIISNAPVELPEIVEEIAVAGYQAGSSLVDPMWSFDPLLKIRLRHAPADSFSEYPRWRAKGRIEAADQGAAFIMIAAGDPMLLKEEDPDHVSSLFRAATVNDQEFARRRMSFEFAWSVVAVPTTAWAERVFPEREPKDAVRQLWEDLAAFCMLDAVDPVSTWRTHVEEIEKRKRTMTDKHYRELHFEGPGTNLKVGLPDRQVWNGGQAATPSGTLFSPNIPTEEVFTMPHRERVDGTVAATRPLHYGGLVVNELQLTFKKGMITDATASEGEEQLARIMATDGGSRRLGEVALVSDDSPISRARRSYFNGLIDENAASHLALGRAYRDCVEGGSSLSEKEFEAAGGNVSGIHIDFMIGSNDLDVYGLRSDGRSEPVLKSGAWQL